MFTLGQYYHLGIGGPANAEEARRWYAAAAEAGYPLAQFNLGLMYEIGYGGERNLATARLWYRRAADQQVERARDALARINEAH
jgi:TPR repeat protein